MARRFGANPWFNFHVTPLSRFKRSVLRLLLAHWAAGCRRDRHARECSQRFEKNLSHGHRAMQTNHELETLALWRRRSNRAASAVGGFNCDPDVAPNSPWGCKLCHLRQKIGRSPTVQTMMVVARTDRQSSVLLTGSGYIVTRHKYIIIGTKILDRCGRTHRGGAAIQSW